MLVLCLIFVKEGDFIHTQENSQENLRIGSIIRAARKARGLSQEDLADILLCDRPKISKLELGTFPFTPERLWETKKALGVERIPLNETECKEYSNLLNLWYEMINDRKFDEAMDMLDELSCIVYVEDEKELNMLFALYKCRLMLGVEDIKAAADIIKSVEPNIDNFGAIEKFHYYYNKGTLSSRAENYQEAIDFNLKALGLMPHGAKTNVLIYYNIAYCHAGLGYFARAVPYLEEANDLNNGEHKSISEFFIDSRLANNYIITGYLRGAKILLDKCMITAESEKDPVYKGIVLGIYGFLYMTDKRPDTALRYFDKSLDCFEKTSASYYETLYLKIQCLLTAKYFTPCHLLIAEGKALAKEDKTYSLLFESLNRLLTPNSDKSTNYIEQTTIPYLEKNNLTYAALFYCNFLIDHYNKRRGRYPLKAERLMLIAYRLLKKIHEGGLVR